MDPQSEVQRLEQQADLIEDNTLESTRRILALGIETQDVGAKTSEMLHHQGDQLDGIERNMDHINAKMKETEKELNEMEKCCGICVLPWSRSYRFKEDKDVWQGSNGQLVNQQPKGARSGQTGATAGSSAGPSGGLVTKIRDNDKEAEMEDNLTQVSDMLGNLKNMAIDFSTEIDVQNKQLDRINVKADCNKTRIDVARARVEKLNA